MTSELHQHHPHHHHQQQQHHNHHISQNIIPSQSSSTSATPHLPHRNHLQQGTSSINLISGSNTPSAGNNQGREQSREGIINHHHNPHHHQQQQQSQHHPHHQQQQHHSRHGSVSNHGTPSLKQQQRNQHPHQLQQHHGGLNNNNNNFVIVELHRDDSTCPGFGFNIKGGSEHGCPVYIWRVEPGSLADQSGLKSGDEIVQANGISFGGISHADALKVLKGQTSLTLYIKAPQGPQPRRVQPLVPPPHTSMSTSHGPPPDQPIPLPPPLPPPHMSQQQIQPPNHSLHHRVEYYTWVDRLGNPVPSPNPQDNFPPSRLIPLEICPGQNLGLMIRGGSEYGLGIYVTGVDPGSVAERVGLQRGDEILSVNSKDFTRITHDKAVQILKSSKHMQIVATHIGKIPADLNEGDDLLKLGETGTLLDDEIVDIDDDEVNMIEMEHSANQRNNPGVESHHHHTHDHDEIGMGGGVDEDEEELLEDELPGIIPVSSSSSSVAGASAAARMNMDESLDLDFVRCSSNAAGGPTGTNKRCTTSILQMIEEKARTVLNKSEHSRFTFYRIEYMQGFLPVVAFVRILLELLNTSEKYTLLTEVRELIRPTDLTQFDELIYSKSTAFRVSSAKATSIIPPPPPLSSVNNNIITTAPTSIPQQMPSNPPHPPPMFEHVIMPNQNNPPPQQQQIPLPPPLPPPPQGFLQQGQQQHHLHPDHLLQDDMVVDDFIEDHGVVLDPSGGFGSWRGGGGNGQPMQQPPQPGQVAQNFGNNGGVGNDSSRQLLITHDPAALTMSHPQILNVMNPSVTSNPTATTATTVATRSPNNMLVPTSLVPHSGTVGAAPGTTATTSTLQTPNKLGTTNTTNAGQMVVASSGTGGSSSSVPAVRFKVRITKVKPILGIAIEGGSNTPHRLPRIIDVNPDGSAFHSNLRAGQVLLSVDSKKLDGLTHEEIARLILDCYVDMTKSQIEFLVVEAKQNYYYYTSQQNI